MGPVIGGWVAFTSGSYEWVFWALVIVGAILLAGVAILLPETARSVVGSGAGRREGVWWGREFLECGEKVVEERRGF